MSSNDLTETLAKETPPATLAELLAQADIRLNGDRPWDVRVRDREFYRRLLTGGSLGLGEAYMDGLWEAPRLDELFDRVIRADLNSKLGGMHRLRIALASISNTLFNRQSPRRARHVGERHYDIGNDLFEAMLDSSMNYSCAYWAEAETLDEAQRHKMDLICRKLELRPGERLLEVGCGWGGLAHYAATHYGVQVLGVTVSREQQALAQQRCAGLPVEISLMDYREIDGTFDKVVSVGMFEHVGEKNYPIYLDTVSRVMSDEGLFLLHTIGTSVSTRYTDPWINKYIFPNGRIPSARRLTEAIEGRYLIEDWHSFGSDYDRTLMEWKANFDQAWPQLRASYDERFYRMWTYYLMSSAGFFRSREGQLWQLVLSKPQRNAVYRSTR
jgi:cyclopropane-fatty-acyl-phospholipid synthase